MSAPDFLIQATFKRLSARIENFLQDGPDRFRKEFKRFYDEVMTEADAMAKDSSSVQVVEDASSSMSTDIAQPQQKVDRLRAKVADLSRKLETLA